MYYIFESILRAVSWSTAFQTVSRPQHQFYTHSTSITPHGSIPGGSPLKYCNESRDTDLYQIEHIELYPSPLHIDDVFEVHLYGKSLESQHIQKLLRKLTHAISGTFLQNITHNATLGYLGRYGNSTESEGGRMDWCGGFIDSIDQPGRHRKHDCPPEKGFGLIMMSSWVMPMFIVPGPYYFRFDAVTREGERIYCLEANVYLDYEDKKGR